MLKQITCIILINSLLFPQYVFAACDPEDPTCQPDNSQFTGETTEDVKPPEKPKMTWGDAKKLTDEEKKRKDQEAKDARDAKFGDTERPRTKSEKDFGEVVGKRQIVDDWKKRKDKGNFAGAGSFPSFPEKTPFDEQSSQKLLEESGAIKFLGTSLFLNCQRQTPKPWPDMVGTYKAKTTTDMWGDSWWTLAKSIEQELENYKLNGGEVEALNKGPSEADKKGQAARSEDEEFPEDEFPEIRRPRGQPTQKCRSGTPYNNAQCKIFAVKDFVKKGIARGKGKSLTLKKCSALVPSTSFMDYNSSEDTLAITPKASLDNKIACRSRGAETQDYPNCRKLVTWWDGFFIGKKLMETAQKVKYQMDAKDRQEDLALDMASKNPDPLLPLKMQKAGVDDQAAVAFQNSFFLGAQYAVMQTKFSQWPSREEIVQRCQGAVTGVGEKTKLDKAQEFFEKFKPKKEESKPKVAAVPEDPNLIEYIKWFNVLISGFDQYAKKLLIFDLLADFKKEKEIPASCPIPPRSLMPMGMQGGGQMDFSYGRGSSMDMYDQGGAGSGEGEGVIGGAARYKSCDEIFMSNVQMDSQTVPPMPQGSLGGAGQMMGGGGGGYQDEYGGGGGGMYGGGGGMMGGGMPGSEMMMGAMLGQSEDPCIDVMNSGTQLILNFQSREALKMVLVQTGIEALTNLMKGMMLRKQSAKIQSLIDGMPVPDPTLDKLSQKEEDLIASVCQIAPQEPICADFSNRSNGFQSPNIDLTPPGAVSTLARVQAEAQGANAIEKAMAEIAAKEFGESAAYADTAGGAGGGAGKSPTVTFKAGEKGAGGGDIGNLEAKTSEAVAAAEKGAAGEEAATPETGYAGGTEGREYKGPGFRADQYKGGGQEGGLDKIAGEYGSMGFRTPSSEGISPKEAGGLFKIISDRYESISKDHRIETKSEIAK